MYTIIIKTKVGGQLFPISNGDNLIDFLISVIKMEDVEKYSFNIIHHYSDKNGHRCNEISGTFDLDYALLEALRCSNDIRNDFDTWCMGFMEGIR